MKLAHFSYLIKVPLALCLVSFTSAVGVFAVTYYLLSSYVSVELMTRMQQISNSVAQSSKLTIQRDEIWDLHQQMQSGQGRYRYYDFNPRLDWANHRRL